MVSYTLYGHTQLHSIPRGGLRSQWKCPLDSQELWARGMGWPVRDSVGILIYVYLEGLNISIVLGQ